MALSLVVGRTMSPSPTSTTADVANGVPSCTPPQTSTTMRRALMMITIMIVMLLMMMMMLMTMSLNKGPATDKMPYH